MPQDDAPASRGPATPRQRELFESLLADFLVEGFADFTIDQAVARHHCSKSTLYALGSTSDDIVRRVVVSFFREVSRRTNLALETYRSPRRALEAYFDAMETALEPASTTFMRDVARHPATRPLYDTNTREATARIRNQIELGIARGDFREVPLDFMARLIELGMEHLQQGDLPASTSGEAYAEFGTLILRGLERH